MSPRVGPILVAIASTLFRLAGADALSDLAALAALSGLTLALGRDTSLQAAARSVHSCNLLLPRGTDAQPAA